VKQVIVPFFISHQGCPHRCIFCDQTIMSGDNGALPSSQEICDTVRRYRASSGLQRVEVAFYGGTFTALPRGEQERLLGAIQPLRAAGEVGGVRISTRPDAIDGESARFLKSMGVTLVEIGAQSFDDEVLRRSGRGYDHCSIEASCRILGAHGLPFGIQLMPGLPGDTPECSHRSFAQAVALRPDCIRLYPTLVIAGTELAELYHQGRYLPMSLPDAVSVCKPMLLGALQAGITVLRMGIQPTVDLVPGASIVAGPFHPAFRQLVESEICLDLLVMLTGNGFPRKEITVTCSPQLVSSIVGQHRRSIGRLQQEYGIHRVNVKESAEFGRYDIQVDGCGNSRRGNILKDLTYA
jgi:histone acetyltransferase (RNA polymerase elongator complex component)